MEWPVIPQSAVNYFSNLISYRSCNVFLVEIFKIDSLIIVSKLKNENVSMDRSPNKNLL